MQPKDITIHPVDRESVTVHRRSLPHWEQPGGVYFVTFRLADSVPQTVIDEYRQAKIDLEQELDQAPPGERWHVERELLRLYLRRIDRCLDVSVGECWMSRSEVATLVASALRFFDRDRYDLLSWVVMPNHVHVILRPLGENDLSQILHSWKSYTGTKANRILGRNGSFWQAESFDHLVRSQRDLFRFARYIEDNPRKSGLRDWPWIWTCEELKPQAGSLRDT